MRIRSSLRLLGVAAIAAVGLMSTSTSAGAWAGLSDKQKAHVDTLIHCSTLMWTNLAQFETEQPPCGGTPPVTVTLLDGASGPPPYRKPTCEYPSESARSLDCPR